jgi:hypothetical protein
LIDEYWRVYSQTLFVYHYHKLERYSLSRITNAIGIFSYIITAVSVAVWGYSGQYAIFWSVMIFASQLANGMKDQLQISKRLLSLEWYLTDISSVLLDVEKGWRLIQLGELTEEDIMERANVICLRESELKNRYIRPYAIDENPKLIDKADKRTDAELIQKHGKEVIENGRATATKTTTF